MTTSDDNPVFDIMNEEGKKVSNWEADLIIIKEFWQELINALLKTFNQRDTQRPWNLCIYGSGFSGKTTFINYAADALRKYKQLDKYGVIKITSLTNSTLKGLYREILKELNWPFSKHDSIQDLEVLVGDAVRKRGCKLIIIDEFNQFYNDGKDQTRTAEILKALRNIPNRTLRPLVVVGTETIQGLLKQDMETNSRFRKVEFPYFDKTDIKWQLLRESVDALDQNLKETTGIESDFAYHQYILEVLFNESEGKMGALIKIYEETAQIALSKKAEKLDSTILQEAVTVFCNNELIKEHRIIESKT